MTGASVKSNSVSNSYCAQWSHIVTILNTAKREPKTLVKLPRYFARCRIEISVFYVNGNKS